MGSQAYFSSSPSPSAAWQPVEVGVQQICYLLSQSVKPGANQAEVRGFGKEQGRRDRVKTSSPPVVAAVPLFFFGGNNRGVMSTFPCSLLAFRARATSLAVATTPPMRQRRAWQAKRQEA